jgi:hypothetical protein
MDRERGTFLESIDPLLIKLGLSFAASFGSKFTYKILTAVSGYSKTPDVIIGEEVVSNSVITTTPVPAEKG